MASMLDRLKNRRCYPVDLGPNAKVYVRALTIGELRALDTLPPELTTAYAIGCALVDDAGNQDLPRGTVPGDAPGDGAKPESNEEYARRLLDELSVVPTDALNEIAAAITRLRDQPPVKELIKN